MRKMKKAFAASLAFAMVLSAVPMTALPVSAATATPKISVTKKYLNLGKSAKLTIANKVKNATYTFTSSNTKIATVNKTTGTVKGIKVGDCTVKLTAKVGKKTYTSNAKILVKEHASTISISNMTDNMTMTIGNNVFECKSSMKTKSGGTCTDTAYYYIIEETNTAGASVDEFGQISIEKTGSFQIVAVASDSLSTFRKKVYRAKSDPITVTVPITMNASMQSVNQIKLVSNQPLNTYNKDDYTVLNMATGQYQRITSVETDSKDNKTVILTLSNTFSKNTTFQVNLAKADLSASFTATYGSINKIVANDQAVAPNIATPLNYQILDENGVDITLLYPHTMAGFEFTFSPTSITLDEYGRITLANKNSYAFYSVKYTYLDSMNRKQVIESNTASVTANASNIKSLKKYTVSTSSNVDWDKPIHSLASGETGRRLYCQFANSVNGTIDTSKTSVSNLTFVSNNTSVCAVDRTTGILYPYKQGTTEITVSDGIFSENVTITVGAPRTIDSLKASKTQIALSSTSGLSNSETIRFELKDQYGDTYKLTGSSSTLSPYIRLISGNDNMVTVNSRYITRTSTPVSTSVSSSGYFDLTFYGKMVGTCTIEVSYGGKTVLLTINIKQPSAVTTYKPELSQTTLDPNVQGKNTATLMIYAVDSNGLKINTLNEGYYSISASDGTVILPNQMIISSTGTIIDATKLKLKDGNYNLTVTSGPVQETITFTVKASDAAVNLVAKENPTTTVTTKDDVVTKILDCFNIYLNGNSNALPASSLVTGSSPLLSNVKVSFTSYDTKYFDSATDLTIGSRDFSKTYDGFTGTLRVTKVSFNFGGQSFSFTPDQDITIRIQNK